MKLPSLLRRICQICCSHRFYMEDIQRLSPDEVQCACYRCGKVLSAPYGLALGDLDRKPKP